MIISSLFSAIIFQGVSRDIEQGFKRGINRMQMEQFAQENGLELPPPGTMRRKFVDDQLRNQDFFSEDIENAKKRLLSTIIITNSIILLLSAISSYYLAGQTLKPIKTAYSQQKRFIADASHELKTPITALKTSLEVNLMDKKLDKITQNILRENLEDVTNLENLTHYLLKLASQKDLKKIFLPTNIYTQAQKAVKQLKPLADKKCQQLNLISKFKDINVMGDENSLFELILIFLDNAIKYTPEKGNITLKLSKYKKHISIVICDTGIGIDPKNIPHIFDRFFQEESSRSKQTDSGFGLGLSVAKQIIDQHKGDISVKSEKGKGSEFTIKFPLHQ